MLFFSSMIITNRVLYQNSVLYYNLCFKEIMQICEKCFFFFCKSVVDIKKKRAKNTSHLYTWLGAKDFLLPF